MTSPLQGSTQPAGWVTPEQMELFDIIRQSDPSLTWAEFRSWEESLDPPESTPVASSYTINGARQPRTPVDLEFLRQYRDIQKAIQEGKFESQIPNQTIEGFAENTARVMTNRLSLYRPRGESIVVTPEQAIEFIQTGSAPWLRPNEGVWLQNSLSRLAEGIDPKNTTANFKKVQEVFNHVATRYQKMPKSSPAFQAAAAYIPPKAKNTPAVSEATALKALRALIRRVRLFR